MNIIEQGPSPWKRILQWVIMIVVVSALSFFINQCTSSNADTSSTESHSMQEYSSQTLSFQSP